MTLPFEANEQKTVEQVVDDILHGPDRRFEYLQTLKLPAFRRSYEALARQAGAEGWPYEDYLRELLEAEVRSRQERAAACRLREAYIGKVNATEEHGNDQRTAELPTSRARLASCHVR